MYHTNNKLLLLLYTHRWCQIHVRLRQWTFFLFSCPQNHSINHLNLYNIYIKQIDFYSSCIRLYCNRSQKISQHVNNNFLTSFVIYYSTHAHKNEIYLFNIYKPFQVSVATTFPFSLTKSVFHIAKQFKCPVHIHVLCANFSNLA